MSKNDITGDKLISKSPSQAFDEGFDRIFGGETCARCGQKMGVKKHFETCLPKPSNGYTAEELERDNPYNQWMYENAESTSTDTDSK
jgi:hypothetical protein